MLDTVWRFEETDGVRDGAEPLNPPGDGSYLFRYTAKGGWRFYAEGSAFECADLGIQVDPNDPPPFCG